jgi:hypothetical protein
MFYMRKQPRHLKDTTTSYGEGPNFTMVFKQYTHDAINLTGSWWRLYAIHIQTFTTMQISPLHT